MHSLLLLLQAIKAGNTLYVSGQIGIEPGTKDFASEGVEGQTEQVRQSTGLTKKQQKTGFNRAA
jgi:enamine deaminase RidA (YjgF/YER057c/UK114 family)